LHLEIEEKNELMAKINLYTNKTINITSLALAFNLACSGSSFLDLLLAARNKSSRSISSCFLRSTLSISSRHLI